MRELSSENVGLVPIGIVGAGRTRNGLGPFLAEFLEKEGFRVRGVSGRSLGRAAGTAETIGQQLGHEVIALGSPAALCASGVNALVVASPSEFHLEALQAAAAAGLPTLCEKPLVHENNAREGARLLDIFESRRLPLIENCQWPYVLPAFFHLHGAAGTGKNVKVEMGLAAVRTGREVIQNTVSHLLSVIQAVAPVDFDAAVKDVSAIDPSWKAAHNIVQFRLVAREKTVDALLHLKICTLSPRPAWLAIDGRRIDRLVGEEYSISFTANGRKIAVEDPTKQLVKHFASLARSRDPVLMDKDRDRIRQRLDWYRQILENLE